MSLEQEIRKFLADPEDLSAAQRLVASLCREVNTAHGDALVSMADTSAKTWRAILEAVVAFDEALRPMLIQALQRILREWPVGSRPLPRWPADSPRLNLLNLVNTKAIELIDCAHSRALLDIAAVDEVEDFSTFKINLRSACDRELYFLTTVEEGRLPVLEDRIRRFLNVGFLERLELSSQRKDHGSYLKAFEYLNSRPVLRDLKVVSHRVNPLKDADFINHVRGRVQKLSVYCPEERLYPLLAMDWPELEELTIDCDGAERPITSLQMPKLKKLTLRFGVLPVELFQSLAKVARSRRIQFNFELAINFINFQADFSHLTLIADCVSKIEVPSDERIQLPVMEKVQIARLFEVWAGESEHYLRTAEGIEELFRVVPNVESLSFEDQEDAFRVVTSESFKNSKVTNLICSHVLSAQSEDFFHAILQSQVSDLSLDLACYRDVEDLPERFDSLARLQLESLTFSFLSGSAQGARVILKSLRDYHGQIDKLELRCRDLSPNEVVEFLRLPMMQSLKSLILGRSVDDLKNLEQFRSLKMPKLESILFRTKTSEDDFAANLFDIDHFPSLLTIRC